MFTVLTCVGKRFGMWLRSDRTFPTLDAAQRYADDIGAAERRFGGKAMWRRVVPA